MSKFIEGSKHAAGTAAVERHFAGGNMGQKSGTDPLLKAAPYGASDWDPGIPTRPAERGLTNTANSAEGPSIFRTAGDASPRESGVNYKPANRAGHTNTADPFSALANGLSDEYGSGQS